MAARVPQFSADSLFLIRPLPFHQTSTHLPIHPHQVSRGTTQPHACETSPLARPAIPKILIWKKQKKKNTGQIGVGDTQAHRGSHVSRATHTLYVYTRAVYVVVKTCCCPSPTDLGWTDLPCLPSPDGKAPNVVVRITLSLREKVRWRGRKGWGTNRAGITLRGILKFFSSCFVTESESSWDVAHVSTENGWGRPKQVDTVSEKSTFSVTC